ncbi:MAG: hypothetical protein PHP37_04460 [Patescibacteria group bacterium]|nr:hypothetical protein [Patescibacteria group bacterium]
MKVVIKKNEEFNKIKEKIKQDGFSRPHILVDFDRTLTYGAIDGVKTVSIMALLRDGNHLTPDYAEKSYELFNKNHVAEINPDISLFKKKKIMQKWWSDHNELLIKSGLKKDDLKDIAINSHLKLRAGVPDFLKFLDDNNVPVVIISASGCGEAIELFLEKNNCNFKNIYYLVNRFSWDKNGRAISTLGPIIHSFNKDETILQDFPDIYNNIKDRKNVLLLGDSLGDLGMIDGFKYDNLLTFGFLNFDYNSNIDEYIEKFNVVLAGDGDFSFLNNLLIDWS